MVRWRGDLAVAEAGEHLFALASDDGAALYVAGALVVDNGGLHSVQRAEGAAVLTAGRAALVVVFVEASGAAVLEALWTPSPNRALWPAASVVLGAAEHGGALSNDVVPPSAADADAARAGVAEALRAGAAIGAASGLATCDDWRGVGRGCGERLELVMRRADGGDLLNAADLRRLCAWEDALAARLFRDDAGRPRTIGAGADEAAVCQLSGEACSGLGRTVALYPPLIHFIYRVH
jgi:hypothetical protein